VTRDGYDFIGWTPDIVAATEDTTYTAQWEVIPVITYQITFDAAGGEGGECANSGRGYDARTACGYKRGLYLYRM
jgi:hypothetical protein